MSKENFLQEMIRINRDARKGFGLFATILWDITTIAYVIILIIFMILAALNPLWFRENFIHWTEHRLPLKLNDARAFLFKKQIVKASFFDTLKNA